MNIVANTPQPDSKVYENLLKQCFELWIGPEIEKRKAENKLPQEFKLKAAQIIFCLGQKPLVRLNSEVKAVASAKIKRSVKKGEAIYNNDVEDIKELRLTDEEKDFGHITIIAFRGAWTIGFSFIYDASKSRELLKIGQTYLASAQKDYLAKNFRPMVESLSIAAENFAKARLYLLPDKEIRKTRRHGLIQAKVNIYSKTSNVITKDFKNTFNRLQSIRDKARYNHAFTFSAKEAKTMLDDMGNLQRDIMHWLTYATNS